MLQEALQEFAYTDHEVFVINLALEEALVNAIKHGNQLDPGKWVNVEFAVTAERFDIRITDEGAGFEFAPDPILETCMEPPRGRGLSLMRAFMTEVQFTGNGNTVTMAKVREVSA